MAEILVTARHWQWETVKVSLMYVEVTEPNKEGRMYITDY